MKELSLKNYRIPFLCSLALHVGLFLFMFTHTIDSNQSAAEGRVGQISAPQPQPLEAPPIKATSVDANAVASEVEKIKQKEAQEALFKQKELQKLQQAKTKAQQAEAQYKKIQAAKQQLQKEIQKNKALAEQQKKQALIEKKQADQIKQELATLKKKQEQTAAELKKKEALENETEKKIEEEALKSEELSELEKPSIEKKKSENLASNDTASEASLSEIDKYRQLITQNIGQNWIVPDNVDKQLSCELIIKVAPGGAVLSVTIAKSSGNATLDRSAQTAVMKASPLPVPEGELFEKFRELSLTVRPEDF